MFSPSIVQSVKNPEDKEVSDVFRRKLPFQIDQRGCHAQSHTAVISPYANSSMSCLEQPTLNGVENILKPIFNDLQPLWIVGNKLGTCSKCITYPQPQKRSNASFNLFVFNGKVLRLVTFCFLHLMENLTVKFSFWIINMHDADSIEKISWNLPIPMDVGW